MQITVRVDYPAAECHNRCVEFGRGFLRDLADSECERAEMKRELMKKTASIKSLRIAASWVSLAGLVLLAGCASAPVETAECPDAAQIIQQKYAEVQRDAEAAKPPDSAQLAEKKNAEGNAIQPCVTKQIGGEAAEIDAGIAKNDPEVIRPGAPLSAGQNVRPFVLTGLKGKPLDLGKTLPGSSLTLLIFADNLCPFSEEAVNRLNVLSEKYSKEELGISVVHVGEADQDAREFYERLNPDYPIGIDADWKITADYGVRAIPMTFLVKPDSEIWYVEIYSPRIEENIAVYLEEGGSERPAPRPMATSPFG